MAYAKKTLSDLKQSLADKHDAGTLPTDSTTLSYWTRLLNNGLAYCADQMRLVTSASTTTTGTATHSASLPTDFLLINRVVDGDGAHLAHISQDQSVNASGLVYWITGNHTNGFVLNTPSNATYTTYYTFKPSEMSSDSDVCVIPDPEAVVLYAYSKLRKAEFDPAEDADQAMADCNRRIKEIVDQMQLNDGELGFSINENTTIAPWFTL